MDNRRENKTLKLLLLIHGLITCAAGVLLIAAPTVIPETVNITISPDQYLLCYFLGSAELSIAFLSVFAQRITDKRSLRLISAAFIVFHISTAILELTVEANGSGMTALILNSVLRIIISVLFWYFGIFRIKIARDH